MKTLRFCFVIFAVVIGLVGSAVSLARTRGDQEQTQKTDSRTGGQQAPVQKTDSRPSAPQEQIQKTESPVKPTVLIRDPNNSNVTNVPSMNSAAFADAASKNIEFRDQLNWTFGGKQQRGWYLYDSLLRQTLRTQSIGITSDFAA